MLFFAIFALLHSIFTMLANNTYKILSEIIATQMGMSSKYLNSCSIVITTIFSRQTLLLFLILVFTSLNPRIEDQVLISVSGESNTALNPTYIGKISISKPNIITSNGTHLFVTTYSIEHQVWIYNNAGILKDQLSVSSSGEDIDLIQDVAVNETHILVLIYYDDTMGELNLRVEIYDLAGNYVSEFGSYGFEDDEFQTIDRINMNETHIFILDSHRVKIFDLAGNYVDYFGGVGSGDGKLRDPKGIELNGTHFFIADNLNRRIQIFNSTGHYVNKFGSEGSGDEQFSSIANLELCEQYIFVSDTILERVQVFNHEGVYITKFGSLGSGEGQFENPRGIFANSSHILVADEMNNRIQIFAKNFPPQQLMAHVGLTSIGLTWKPPLDHDINPVSVYRIYRGQQPKDYAFLVETSFLSYNDLTTVINQMYYYVVTSLTVLGESVFSNEVSAEVGSLSTETETVTGPTETLTETFSRSTETITQTITGPTVTHTTVEQTNGLTEIITTTSVKTEQSSVQLIPILLAVAISRFLRFRMQITRKIQN